jgi:polyisoprenoid-binding protein YceI
MMRRLAFALTALAATLPAAAQDTWVVDKAHSEVTFQIRHFVTKVRGRFQDFTGTIVADAAKPEASSVEFTIKAASIDTDNDYRDKDLRGTNFFDVEKFPEITFKSARVAPAGKESKDGYEVTGLLTMRGVSREIVLPVTYLGSVATKDREGRAGAKAGFSTSLTLNRKDYGITWNRALDTGGFMLGDDVQVEINIEANKKAPEAPSS